MPHSLTKKAACWLSWLYILSLAACGGLPENFATLTLEEQVAAYESIFQKHSGPLVEARAQISKHCLATADLMAEYVQGGWTSRANLLADFEKHGADFGFKLAEQYALAAKRFVSTVGREGVETVVAQTGDRMVFNQATREFALVNKEGEVATYFKASARYWRKLKDVANAITAVAVK